MDYTISTLKNHDITNNTTLLFLQTQQTLIQQILHDIMQLRMIQPIVTCTDILVLLEAKKLDVDKELINMQKNNI